MFNLNTSMHLHGLHASMREPKLNLDFLIPMGRDDGTCCSGGSNEPPDFIKNYLYIKKYFY